MYLLTSHHLYSKTRSVSVVSQEKCLCFDSRCFSTPLLPPSLSVLLNRALKPMPFPCVASTSGAPDRRTWETEAWNGTSLSLGDKLQRDKTRTQSSFVERPARTERSGLGRSRASRRVGFDIDCRQLVTWPPSLPPLATAAGWEGVAFWNFVKCIRVLSGSLACKFWLDTLAKTSTRSS